MLLESSYYFYRVDPVKNEAFMKMKINLLSYTKSREILEYFYEKQGE